MRRPAALLGALTTATALALTGCGGEEKSAPELSVGSAYMPQPLSPEMAAGFLTVRNGGDKADTLTHATSDVGKVELHKVENNAMRETDGMAVPAHGTLELASGGNHLMFLGMKKAPREGQRVSVRLEFAHSDPVTVEVPVKSPTYRPKAG